MCVCVGNGNECLCLFIFINIWNKRLWFQFISLLNWNSVDLIVRLYYTELSFIPFSTEPQATIPMHSISLMDFLLNTIIFIKSSMPGHTCNMQTHIYIESVNNKMGIYINLAIFHSPSINNWTKYFNWNKVKIVKHFSFHTELRAFVGWMHLVFVFKFICPKNVVKVFRLKNRKHIVTTFKCSPIYSSFLAFKWGLSQFFCVQPIASWLGS